MRNRDRNEIDNAPLSTQRKLTSVQFNELASLVATISEPDELVERILRFVKRQLVADRGAFCLR